MSKEKKANKNNRQLVDQDLSPKEKKIIGIIGAVAILLIILVCVITVISGQGKNVIKNAYGLDKHSFTYITLDEVQSKKNAGDDFHLLIVRKPTSTESKTATFVKVVNEKISEDSKINTIYLLEIETFTVEQRRELVNIIGNGLTYETFTGGSFNIPTLVHFVNRSTGEISGYSTLSSATDQINEYFNNYKNDESGVN